MGILGLTYKPDTDVVEEAAGFLLLKELMERGTPTLAYDPKGRGAAKRILGENARFSETPEECINSADVVVITTPWQEFAQLPAEVWTNSSVIPLVIDCWGALEGLRARNGMRYIRLGVAMQENR